MDILNNLNLQQNEIQNAVAQNLVAAPANPKPGQFYFDTNIKRLGYYNGTTWEYSGDTTYTFDEGEKAGQIMVTPSTGESINVSVKGLGTAAYKNTDTSLHVDTVSGNIPTAAAIAKALSQNSAAIKKETNSEVTALLEAKQAEIDSLNEIVDMLILSSLEDGSNV